MTVADETSGNDYPDRFSSVVGDRRGSGRPSQRTVRWAVTVGLSRRLSRVAAQRVSHEWQDAEGLWWCEYELELSADCLDKPTRTRLQHHAFGFCAAAGVKAVRTPQVRRL
jgi:hypothetical protein